MDRKEFLKSLAFLPFSGCFMNNNVLNKISEGLAPSDRMPVLFLGHGSPMNAIEENEFVRGFRKIGHGIPKPQAILCISAHWETEGTFVAATPKPKTIHDFGGFPQALYDVQYPAPGSPKTAQQTKDLVKSTTVALDHTWGLDHGAWSVIKHLYPAADVPVLQLSIDYTKGAQHHYDLAKELSALRSKGILIVGSGNMVHNLGMVAWDRLNDSEYGYDWALEVRAKMKQYILEKNHKALINYKSEGKAFSNAIPTPEHYLPLLYSLALQQNDEQITFYNDKAIGGSLTMTSVKIDKA